MSYIDPIKRILEDLKSEDFLVRCDAIENLASALGEKASDLIARMLDDRNYLVRCEAYDALIEIESFKEIDILLKHLRKERSSMARLHAVAAICEKLDADKTHESVIQSLKELFEQEKATRVSIAYYALFYKIEKQGKFVDLTLGYLDDADYHIRLNVINLLHDVTDENVAHHLLDEYMSRYQTEESRSVKTLLEDEIGYLENFNQ